MSEQHKLTVRRLTNAFSYIVLAFGELHAATMDDPTDRTAVKLRDGAMHLGSEVQKAITSLETKP